MRILYITTISLTMNSFFKPHIEMLVSAGHKVDIACNYQKLPVDEFYNALGCSVFQVDFARSPLSIENISAFLQLKRVIEYGCYDVVHCHTPTAAVITRVVCQRYRRYSSLKVFYTAHGFHFYKGAPKINWILYYPVEKICSFFTDKLITINKEDYELAKNRLHAKEIYYVPGVGIDLSKFINIRTDRKGKRLELGVPDNALLLLSIGELNINKNHQLVIKALAKLNDKSIHYVIAGAGPQMPDLLALANELGIAEQIHLLGYRTDVLELYVASDVFCLPSYREGLSVSLMEAMACGLPVICSSIRGNVDLIDIGSGLMFSPHSVEQCEKALQVVFEAERNKISEENLNKILYYSKENVLKMMRTIYEQNVC